MSVVSDAPRLRGALLIAMLAITAPGVVHAQSYSAYASTECYYTSCWWDRYGRHVCHWVCRRRTPEYYAPDPGFSNTDPAPFIVFGLVGLIIVVAIGLCVENAGANDVRLATDEALAEAEEAATAQAKLDQAIRDVDDVIRRQAARAYERGRNE